MVIIAPGMAGKDTVAAVELTDVPRTLELINSSM
jgi:hypothetical protein